MKGITHAEMETIYSVGLSYYKTGNYEQAGKLFRFLCFFDHVNSKFWTAQGGVYQATRQFEQAVQAYQFAIFLDCQNARAIYYLAECYAAIDQPETAIAMTALLEHVGVKGDVQRVFLEKAKALRARLEADTAETASKKGV